jgi:hypothetical protein
MAFGKYTPAGLAPQVPQATNAFGGAPRPAGLGGMGGMGGAAAPVASPTTTSLDLPQSLSSIINGGPQVAVNDQAIQAIQTGTVGANPNASVLDFRMQPTYADGGMVGENGMPDMTGLGGGSGLAPQGEQKLTPQMIEMQIKEFLRSNPQQVAEFKQVVSYLMQTGELTPDELNLAGQLALTALQNPDLYPNLRNFAIQQGLAEEDDLSPEYDQGLIFALLLAVRAIESETNGSAGNALQAQAPAMNMADGGYVTAGDHAADGGAIVGKGTGRSDSIPIRVSNGEYVIPAHIVKMKGKEFFDSMLDKYKDSI